jgi:elongator complex protein 2
VGRDRQWTLFKRDQGQRNNYKMSSSNPKGHTRMILDAAWAPTSLATFATAGRDKQIKIWAENKGSEDFTQKATISEDHPVTAIDFLNVSKCDNLTFLAVGTEVGTFRVYSLAINQEFSVSEIQAIHQM